MAQAELTLDAVLENVGKATEFVENQMLAAGCSERTVSQINIAVDELFANIARYAYPDKPGSVTICVETEKEPPEIAITFKDGGIPYNPLEKEDPDIHLSVENRKPGGLGVYIVKKSMDGVTYDYKDGQNILRIRKGL